MLTCLQDSSRGLCSVWLGAQSILLSHVSLEAGGEPQSPQKPCDRVQGCFRVFVLTRGSFLGRIPLLSSFFLRGFRTLGNRTMWMLSLQKWRIVSLGVVILAVGLPRRCSCRVDRCLLTRLPPQLSSGTLCGLPVPLYSHL